VPVGATPALTPRHTPYYVSTISLMMNIEHGISNVEVLARNIGTSSFIIGCSMFDILRRSPLHEQRVHEQRGGMGRLRRKLEQGTTVKTCPAA